MARLLALNLSTRERRLAIAAGVLILVFPLYLAGRQLHGRLRLLDGEIDALEQQVLYSHELTNQADAIDERFNAIAVEHSSGWTQEQIHSRLSLEITRLCAKNVPPRDTPAPPGSPMLVTIRQLPSGTLNDTGEGYREYHMEFRTEPTSIHSLVTFLSRLQESPQALRIDRLDLVRPPESEMVTATVAVTRTVIDDDTVREQRASVAQDPGPSGNLIQNPGFEERDSSGAGVPKWAAEGAEVSQGGRFFTEGSLGLTATLAEGVAEAHIYQKVTLEAGQCYDLTFDLAAEGDVTVGLLDEMTGALLDKPVQVVSDGGFHRYHLRFTAPDASGNPVAVRVPFVAMSGDGARMFLDNVSLSKGGS